LPKDGTAGATKRRRAATTEVGGRVVLVEGPANSRLFLNLGGKYLHRVERERRELYAGDHDLAIVVEVIAAASTDPLMRDPAYLERHEYFLAAIPIEEQRGVSASSIAKSSAIPRETVRRKIRRLLELGLIVEKEPARYVLKPGSLMEPHRQAAFTRGIGETVRFINELLHYGLIRWVPAPNTPPGATRSLTTSSARRR
jgi:hypothetical protein